ncbi:MAG: hypothetical protein F4Z29_08790 [Gemmatimonadetes bacterium]|nr:hypothetical protein [Gemmatimonadota bacterium]
MGYGVEAFGGGLLTPYAGSELVDGTARRYRVGTRLQLAREAATGLTLNLEGRRQERADPQPLDQDLRIQIRWRF